MRKEYLALLAAGCVAANAANVNYDLLGRKGSKMNSPMVYKNVDYSKVKKNEAQKVGPSLETKALAKQASGIKSGAKAIIGGFGPKGYDFKNCSNKTSGCGESVYLGRGSLYWSDYQKRVNNEFIEIISHEKPIFSSDYSFVTAGATRSYLSGYDAGEFPYNAYGYVTSASTFNKNMQITYSPIDNVKGYLNRNSYPLLKTNVGIYLDEDALPVRLNPNKDANSPFILADNASMDDFNTAPGYEMRASRMYRLIQNFSDLSAVYAVKGQPLNPAATTKGPQIYMGLHANGGPAKSAYTVNARDLDNYIYNNRTVEIVGAGNTAGNLSARAFAVNAITVGALDPITKRTASYSAQNLPRYCSYGYCDTYDKPEFENYSNFYTDDYYRRYVNANKQYEYYPYYDGTETAAGVTAGMISNMLSYNEFYKWHPEVVKAVMLNLNQRTGNGLNYNSLVFNQKDELNLHHSYYFIGDVNTLMKKNGFNPKEIKLSFSRVDLVRGTDLSYLNVDGFRVSISWLNSGNDIANLEKLPQNFDIYVYKEDGMNLRWLSDTENNIGKSPFKTTWVDGFAMASSANFVVQILLNEEDPDSENYGQMVLGLDIMPIIKY